MPYILSFDEKDLQWHTIQLNKRSPLVGMSEKYETVATNSCKNVETRPWKNDLSCFKSLLVTGL